MYEPGRDALATGDAADGPPTLELEGAPARRATPRARLVRIALVALICLAAGGMLLREIGLARPPGATVPPGPAGPVVLLSNVSYGAVSLNGRRLKGSPPLVLPLENGWNRIMLAPAPFATQTCRLQWSAQGWSNGDCPATGPEYANTVVINGLVIRPSLVIVFRLTGSDLSPALYAGARALVARQFAAVSFFARPVPAGEPIAVGGHWPDDIASRPAATGARADMLFGLYDDQSGEPRPVKCDLALCAGSLIFITASASLAPVWNVAPDAYYVWRVTERSGDPVESLPYPVSPTLTVPLTYDAQLGWQPLADRIASGYPLPVEALLDGTFCDAGIYALNALTQARGYVATVVGNYGPDGCVIALRSQALQPLGRFLWRWGVLLAADSDASFALPDLPVASPAEIAALSG